MRIISGLLKGKRIHAPSSLPARPTTDRAKEGLFSYLNARVDLKGKTCLDIFSGIGSISFEMLSRGASHIIAVDKNPGCVNFIRETAKNLNLNSIQVFRTDALIALERVKNTFDIIFADPPYDYNKYQELVRIITAGNLINQGGWFIIEHPSGISFNQMPHFHETRRYGKVHFSFFHKPESINQS